MQLLSFLTSTDQRDVKTHQLSSEFCVCLFKWIIFWQGWLGYLGSSLQSVSQSRWGNTPNPKARNSVFNILHLWPAEVRESRALVPAAKSVPSLLIESTPGQSEWRFHPFSQLMEKKMSLSPDIICTLIWRTLSTCHSPVKEDYEILIPLSERLLKLITKALYPME